MSKNLVLEELRVTTSHPEKDLLKERNAWVKVESVETEEKLIRVKSQLPLNVTSARNWMQNVRSSWAVAL